MITVLLPIKLQSVANLRLHWSAKARLAKAHRSRARVALQADATNPPSTPLAVVLTRIAPRRLDSDNLASAFKAVRDGVADWLGVDDGHPDIEWRYEQRTGGAKVYAIEIEVIA
jgi:hypothetical protein